MDGISKKESSQMRIYVGDLCLRKLRLGFPQILWLRVRLSVTEVLHAEGPDLSIYWYLEGSLT